MSIKELRETIVAFGHENIQAIHPSTLMFTKEKELSKTGDCIVGVAADKAAVDLSQSFKAKLKMPNAKLTIVIEAGSLAETINSYGSQKLILTHPTDIVVRKSEYISDRTLAICSDKASSDLPRALVEKLKKPDQKINITLLVRA